MELSYIRCRAVVEFSASDIAYLNGFAGVDDAGARRSCQFQTGHAGQHVNLAQIVHAGDLDGGQDVDDAAAETDGLVELWIWWNDAGDRRIAPAPRCGNTSTTAAVTPAQQGCLLPAGHPGPDLHYQPDRADRPRGGPGQHTAKPNHSTA